MFEKLEIGITEELYAIDNCILKMNEEECQSINELKLHSWTISHATLAPKTSTMEEGTVRKNTIFVGGVAEQVDEAALLEHFSTFGIQLWILGT